MKSNKLLIDLSKHSLGWILLSIILGFLGAIFNGIGVTLIIPLILNLLGLEVVDFERFPPILRSIFQAFEAVPEQFRMPVMMGCVVLAIVLKNISTYSNALTSGVLSRRLSSSLRKKSLRLLLDVDLDYFSAMSLGDVISYVNNEVGRTAAAVSTIIRLVSTGITIVVFLGFLILLSWKLTLLATFLLGIVSLINQFSVRKAKIAGREISRTAAALSRHVIEVLSGIRLVKSVAYEDEEYIKLASLIRQRERATYESQLIMASVGPINEVASIFALITLVMVGRMMFANQMQAFSSVILAYLLLSRLLPFIGQMNNARTKLANAVPSIEIMEAFLKRDSKPIMHPGNLDFDDVHQEIRFKDVCFRYPNSDNWNICNLDLVLPKGKTLALVGASGAGKSTIADLLARFYDPSSGRLEVDGIDLREFDLHQYRHKIGIVSQETFLFNVSVQDNIRYGCPSATDEEVFQAAKQANALAFIQDLPNGFDTLIGNRGVLLSGGQRQRIAIARALLQEPAILILDEATSALDTVSERLVQQALENLSRERTTLVIAHRLSTVQNADQIVALDKGKVVEIGTHKELLQKGGYYAKLHSTQLEGDKPDHDLTTYSNWSFRDDFVKISYEIRSYLNGILGIFQFLDEEIFYGSGEYEEMTDGLSRSTLKVLRLLENLERKEVA